MKDVYKSEIEGMREFYEELEGFNITPNYDCNTDGRVEGTLVEIKLNNSGGIPHKQLKRYIDSYNAKALPIPRYSLYVVINPREFTFIDNMDWKTINTGTWESPKELLNYLNRDVYLLGKIHEYSIVAYNDLFYSKHVSNDKEDFIKEIQNPKELNIEPYLWNDTGDMERSILDCIGGNELRKRLGAFFTPKQYVKIATEYLRKAIKEVPKGYDYIILDRCAGTGNLEESLTPEELKHCVLNTYVYAEWTTLKGLYEGRVRKIIPHTHDNKDPDGLLTDGDALTEDFDRIITKIIDGYRKAANGKLVVIGLENPPYFAPQSEATRSGKTTKKTVKYVSKLMHKSNSISGAMINDLASQFIWSMINKYKPTNYIVFSPIKTWKNHEKFIVTKIDNIYLCNRKHFHATEAAIGLFNITNYTIKQDELRAKSDLGNKIIKRNHYQTKPHKLLDPKSVPNNYAEIIHTSGTPDYKHACLVNTKQNKCGRHIKMDNKNVFQALPLWVANCYKAKDYTEKEVIMKSGDGGTKYTQDQTFLDDCFLWSCLAFQNKCYSDVTTMNELCLLQNTKADKILNVNEKHDTLLKKWNKIICIVKTKEEWNSEFTYGLAQICRDINVKTETGDYDKRKRPIMQHKYNDLNAAIKELKLLLQEFYVEHLEKPLFAYELLK